MKHGWTGGQYSLYRGILGAYLFVHFVSLIPWGTELFSGAGALADASASPLSRLFPNILTWWDAPLVVTSLLTIAAALSAMFAVGRRDRVVAIGLWYVWACLVGRNPLIGNPGIPYVGWLLVAHAFIPPAPFGSWDARGRTDPGGGWTLPPRIFGVAWILMALGYSYSGYTKLVSPSWIDGTALSRVLENPLARPGPIRELALELPAGVLQLATWGALALELLFAPLALFRTVRPWLWLAMVAMHASLIVVIDFADLTAGMLMLHLFTFDPAWIRPRRAGRETLFYDGSCGLCHRAVRFVLAEETGAATLRFAPLGGTTFRQLTAGRDPASLPDSIVVRRADGELLVRSAAVLHVMSGLGGVWRGIAGLFRIVPRIVLDRLYDGIAYVRQHVFARPSEICPILPGSMLERFDA